MPVNVMRCRTIPSCPVMRRPPCHPVSTNVELFQGGRSHHEHTAIPFLARSRCRAIRSAVSDGRCTFRRYFGSGSVSIRARSVDSIWGSPVVSNSRRSPSMMSLRMRVAFLSTVQSPLQSVHDRAPLSRPRRTDLPQGLQAVPGGDEPLVPGHRRERVEIAEDALGGVVRREVTRSPAVLNRAPHAQSSFRRAR